MNISIQQVHEMVKDIKQEVLDAGIPVEDVDIVASTLASLRLSEHVSSTNNSSRSKEGFDLPLTFAEWAGQYDIKNHHDQFLAVATYLLKENDVKEFDTKLVMSYYDKARWKKPKNSADVIGKAANKGYFTEVEHEDREDKKKLWRMTRTGLNIFNSLMKEENNE